MSTFQCDDNYNCESNYLQEFYVIKDTNEYDVVDIFMDLSLAFLGIITLTQFGLLFHRIYNALSFTKKQPKKPSKVSKQTKLDKLIIPDNKQVKIIRGVPGIGKRSYVYYLESDLNREFVICDINDFFTTNGTYSFNGKNLAEAEANMMSKFITSINNTDRRIYVIGTFEKKWMYNNYINIAKLNGYATYVTELDCGNTTELRHFNKRSVHNVPYSKSMKAYTSWEADNTAYKRSPYLSDNDELQSKRYPCLIFSDSNSDSDSNLDSDVESESPIKIPVISNLVDTPQLRELKYLPASAFTDFKKIKAAFNTLKTNTNNTLYTILERSSGDGDTCDSSTESTGSQTESNNSPAAAASVAATVAAEAAEAAEEAVAAAEAAVAVAEAEVEAEAEITNSASEKNNVVRNNYIVNTNDDLNDLPALLCLKHDMLASIGGTEYMNKYYGAGPWDHLCCKCYQ